jgi:hypothetical protein
LSLIPTKNMMFYGYVFKERDVLNLVVSGGSTWDIIAMNVKRLFQLKSFSIL